MREPGDTWVVAPEDETAAVGNVCHRAANSRRDATNSIGISRSVTSAPSAKFNIRARVRSTERVHQSPYPWRRVRYGRSGWRSHAEGKGLWAITIRNPSHCCSDQLKRVVPVDPLPTGIRIALWSCSLKRVRQPFRVIHQFGGSQALCAKCLAGWVRGVRMESNKIAVLDFRHVAAACDTQSAIAMEPHRAALHMLGIGNAGFDLRAPNALLINRK